MGYVERHSTGQRTGVAVAVALLHGAVALGVMAAFAGGVVPQTIVKWTPGLRVDPQPTATPTPEPTHATTKPHIISDPYIPPRPLDLGGGSTITTTIIPAGPTPVLPPVGPIDLGPPTPPTQSAGLAPRAARPLGKPGLWVTNDDYPTGAMRRGEQGVTVFHVTVGPDGRVRDCTVARSSGSAELDQATCAKVTARARFAPATDSSGEAVAGTYANSIRWEIPQ